MQFQNFGKNILIGLSFVLVAEKLLAAMPYPSELKVLKELGCNYTEYANTPEAIENLLEVELGSSVLYSQQGVIPELKLKGLAIHTSGVNQAFGEILIIPIPNEEKMPIYAVIMNDFGSKGEKLPVLTTAVIDVKELGICDNTDIQTWSYNQQGKTTERTFYSADGELIKNYQFGRPVLPLEEIFPDYGECTDEFVYTDLKTAQMAAATPKQVKIAIVDSGVDYNHPYLAPLIDRDQVKNNSVLPDDEILINGPFTQNAETFSHGTAVAFAASQMDQRIGILPYKVTDGWAIAAGLKEAIKQGPHIVNLSLATKWTYEGQQIYNLMKAHPEILFVVAAGNDGQWLDDPRVKSYPTKVNLPNVITVASTDSTGKLSVFTNYGAYNVEVAYIGENVLLPLTQSSFIPMSGTSFSAPLVANVAANMKIQNPKLTASDLKNGLMSTAKALPILERWKLRSGIVNPQAAMNWAKAKNKK